MADNVAITAGTGTTIGTDEVTIGGVSQHVQRVKLVDGTDGGTGLIGGDATNGLDVDVTRLPALVAGTALIGQVSASDETSTVYNGTTALTPKFAAIAAASSGNNTLLAAVTGKKIRVLQMMLMAAGTVNVYITSGAGGTVIFGGSTNKINLVASTGFVLPYSPVGWFETASATLLNINLSAAIAVSGGFVYVEV